MGPHCFAASKHTKAFTEWRQGLRMAPTDATALIDLLTDSVPLCHFQLLPLRYDIASASRPNWRSLPPIVHYDGYNEGTHMRPVDFGLRGTTAYGRVDPRLDLAPIFRPMAVLPPKQTVVLVGPCGVGKSTVVGEAIANLNREIGRDGRGQRELFIVSLTSRRGTAIELQRKLNHLREQQVERNESCVFPETVLYLDADDRSDLWRQGSVVVRQSLYQTNPRLQGDGCSLRAHCDGHAL